VKKIKTFPLKQHSRSARGERCVPVFLHHWKQCTQKQYRWAPLISSSENKSRRACSSKYIIRLCLKVRISNYNSSTQKTQPLSRITAHRMLDSWKTKKKPRRKTMAEWTARSYNSGHMSSTKRFIRERSKKNTRNALHASWSQALLCSTVPDMSLRRYERRVVTSATPQVGSNGVWRRRLRLKSLRTSDNVRYAASRYKRRLKTSDDVRYAASRYEWRLKTSDDVRYGASLCCVASINAANNWRSEAKDGGRLKHFQPITS